MPQKYSERNIIQKAPAKFSSDDDSINSHGEDIAKIFTAFNDHMEKKDKSKQKHISAECEKTIQNMSRLSNELVLRQKKEIDAKVNEYRRKFEELEDEKLSIVKKLKSEKMKYLQVLDLIVVELFKVEVAQEKTNQTFEKKLASFIDDTSSLLKSPSKQL
ncbi:hypothetical protein C1645_880802 [Glomus cerebriforme]|uniref:Uncharacterized protein n=1 Tax=Glomus cerebriforme TaxID=658196 RepID=A0A397SDV2_9GLOM|nr:hypothetical protein C1645_880802 [Glomus cerebriforme]